MQNNAFSSLDALVAQAGKTFETYSENVNSAYDAVGIESGSTIEQWIESITGASFESFEE
jgi:hypothetical protein